MIKKGKSSPFGPLSYRCCRSVYSTPSSLSSVIVIVIVIAIVIVAVLATVTIIEQASLVVTFVPPNSFTPYKIVNKTKKIRAIIYQKDAVRGPEEEYRKIELGPDGECEYSWDEPTKTKKLKMKFFMHDGEVRVTYNTQLNLLLLSPLPSSSMEEGFNHI